MFLEGTLSRQYLLARNYPVKSIPAGKLLVSGHRGGIFTQPKDMVQSVPVVINCAY